MAHTTVTMKNPNTGELKSAPIGFSWTTFFFGMFPALFRGDFKWAAIQFVLAICTLGFSGIYFIFCYNKIYLKSLFDLGFRTETDTHTSAVAVALSMNPDLIGIIDNKLKKAIKAFEEAYYDKEEEASKIPAFQRIIRSIQENDVDMDSSELYRATDKILAS